MVARLRKVLVRQSDKRLPFYERPMNEDVEALVVVVALVEEEAAGLEVEANEEVVLVEAEAGAAFHRVVVVDVEAFRAAEDHRLQDCMEHPDSMVLDRKEYLDSLLFSLVCRIPTEWMIG